MKSLSSLGVQHHSGGETDNKLINARHLLSEMTTRKKRKLQDRDFRILCSRMHHQHPVVLNNYFLTEGTLAKSGATLDREVRKI